MQFLMDYYAGTGKHNIVSGKSNTEQLTTVTTFKVKLWKMGTYHVLSIDVNSENLLKK